MIALVPEIYISNSTFPHPTTGVHRLPVSPPENDASPDATPMRPKALPKWTPTGTPTRRPERDGDAIRALRFYLTEFEGLLGATSTFGAMVGRLQQMSPPDPFSDAQNAKLLAELRVVARRHGSRRALARALWQGEAYVGGVLEEEHRFSWPLARGLARVSGRTMEDILGGAIPADGRLLEPSSPCSKDKSPNCVGLAVHSFLVGDGRRIRAYADVTIRKMPPGPVNADRNGPTPKGPAPDVRDTSPAESLAESLLRANMRASELRAVRRALLRLETSPEGRKHVRVLVKRDGGRLASHLHGGDEGKMDTSPRRLLGEWAWAAEETRPVSLARLEMVAQVLIAGATVWRGEGVRVRALRARRLLEEADHTKDDSEEGRLRVLELQRQADQEIDGAEAFAGRAMQYVTPGEALRAKLGDDGMDGRRAPMPRPTKGRAETAGPTKRAKRKLDPSARNAFLIRVASESRRLYDRAVEAYLRARAEPT